MQETTVFTYRIALSQAEWTKASEARRAAGDLNRPSDHREVLRHDRRGAHQAAKR
ncbi:hypothetical protein [Sulfobacillus thermosulfidooxidans]|uniref:hypothetical protein n=1 Tax=Sulfobacillus thermosulfidooxidans TaxID=28034 RepID=UPI00041709D8|nr:hypothetical protein [Sulfobacillus thermosulfidooxidans]